MTELAVDSVELRLRDELVRGDAAIAGARPILRHLLAHDDLALFSDETIARVRGMVAHIAVQLLFAQGEAEEAGDLADFVAEREDRLAQALAADAALLGHAHALTIEAQLAARLQSNNATDAVLSPLLRDLTGDADADIAALAMAMLAAQARFMQHHRRMELPLGELPGELFHQILVLHGSWAGANDAAAEAAGQRLRAAFDEGSGRLGLATRLIMAIDRQAGNALAIDHAGLALFATALAMASHQQRDGAVLSLADLDGTRLVLSLRAAGLTQAEVERQLLQLQPETALPEGFELLPAERAAALLAAAQ